MKLFSYPPFAASGTALSFVAALRRTTIRCIVACSVVGPALYLPIVMRHSGARRENMRKRYRRSWVEMEIEQEMRLKRESEMWIEIDTTSLRYRRRQMVKTGVGVSE